MREVTDIGGHAETVIVACVAIRGRWRSSAMPFTASVPPLDERSVLAQARNAARSQFTV